MTGGIDDITPHVEIEGDAANTLTEIGSAGSEAFKKIGDAAEAAYEPVGAIDAAAKRAGISFEEMAARAKAASAGVEQGAHGATAAVTAQTAAVAEHAAALKELGVIGAEAFAKIMEKAAGGDFVGLVTMAFGQLAGAITEVVQKAAEFVEQSAAMVETLTALSTATGMTVPELIGLKDAFASVGIGANAFERAIGRLALTVANDWSAIEKNVRTSADAQASAMLHSQQAAFDLQKAYQNLQFVLSSTSATAQHDALNIESAALALLRAQTALNNSALKSQSNALNIEGAELALRRAQSDLRRDEGHPDYEQNEKNLKLEESRHKVAQAEQRLAEARAKKRDDDALKKREEESAVAKADQGIADAARKRVEDQIKASNEVKQAQFNITKARIADSEAAEKQHELDLKDLPKITKELADVRDGYKTWDQVLNHSEISAKSFTDALVKNAAQGKNEMPSVKAVFDEMVKVFPKLGDSADAQAKKIAVMQHAMGAGFRAGGASAAQMFTVFERGKEYLDSLAAAAEKLEHQLDFKGTIEPNLKAFQAAYTSMNTIVDLFKAKLSSILAIPLTMYFDAISKSLKDPEGLLNKIVMAGLRFVEIVAEIGIQLGRSFGTLATPLWTAFVTGVNGIMDVLSEVVKAIKLVGTVLDQVFNAKAGTSFDVITAAVLGVVLAMSKFTRATALAMAKFDLFVGALGLFLTAAGNVVAVYKRMSGEVDTLAKAHDNLAENLGKKLLSGATGGASEAMFDSLKQKPDANKDDAEVAKAAKDLKEAADKSKDTSVTQKEAADKHSAAADKSHSAASKLDEASAAIIKDSASSANALKDAAGALKDSATQIVRAAAVIAAARPSGKAGGGRIQGPGGPTDDLAGLYALSDGEYVVRSAAVAHYGTGLFDALNDLNIGGFASGGQVGASQAESGTSSGGLKQAAAQLMDAADELLRAAHNFSDESKLVLKAFEEAVEGFDKVGKGLEKAAVALTQAAQALAKAASALGTTTVAAGAKAGGGEIHGPGGPTSDTAGLFALSDGEYVVRSAAVSHYGTDLFNALNNLSVGGFAMGGQVGNVTPPRAMETPIAEPSSILNLTIDGQHFDGMTAPDHVATRLKNYAVTRQTTAAGRRPTWAA